MQKILIIRFSSIGDIVLTTPLLRAIKQQNSQIEVHYLTKKEYADVIRHNPYIDKLFLIDNDIRNIVKQLRKEKYDHIIDLHKNLRSFRIKKALGIPATSFEKLNWEKLLLVKFNINNLPKVHIVDRYFATLRKLRIKNDKKGLEYYSGLEDEKQIKGLDEKIADDYAVLVVGGTYFTKQIPIEKLLEIIQAIKIPVVLAGGPSDVEIAQEVIEQSEKTVYNAVGISDINESAEIVRRSSFVVTGDTGLMHIAAAYQKRIYSVWGNTVPEFGMTPYMPEHPERFTIIEIKELKCRPCSKLGHNTCPQSHFDCMMKIDFNKIF